MFNMSPSGPSVEHCLIREGAQVLKVSKISSRGHEGEIDKAIDLSIHTYTR